MTKRFYYWPEESNNLYYIYIVLYVPKDFTSSLYCTWNWVSLAFFGVKKTDTMLTWFNNSL